MPIDRSLDNPTSADVLGMGFFGASDAEKQDRMAQALNTAVIRRNAANVGGSISGISANEMTASETRLLGSLRTKIARLPHTRQLAKSKERHLKVWHKQVVATP